MVRWVRDDRAHRREIPQTSTTTCRTCRSLSETAYRADVRAENCSVAGPPVRQREKCDGSPMQVSRLREGLGGV